MTCTMNEGGAAERLLRKDRIVVAAALAVLVALAAAYTVAGVGMNMSAIDMTRMARPPGAPMSMPMAPVWTASYAALVFLMWWIMMIAMMTPSATPLALLYVAVKRMGADRENASRDAGLLIAGYLSAWAVFSQAAALLHWAADLSGATSAAMMTLNGRWLAGLVLIVAGLYQFTPLKRACLTHCRAPAQFLADHNRPGAFGALRMGAAHGAYCLGCCWALMALLFVGGIMNLVWIAGLAAYVLIEKYLPYGEVMSKVAGAGLFFWGVMLFATGI